MSYIKSHDVTWHVTKENASDIMMYVHSLDFVIWNRGEKDELVVPIGLN